MVGDDAQKLVEHGKHSNPSRTTNHGRILIIHSSSITRINQRRFVDGTLNRPTHNPNEQQQWDRCNILVKTCVIHRKDARTMWLELQERFSHTNTVQLFNIENAIHECAQGTGTVTSFFTKLKGLWDEKDALCGFPPCTCATAAEVKTYMETRRP
ncbi:hypothetical protein AAG906_021887 [Vitis piasezkii]